MNTSIGTIPITSLATPYVANGGICKLFAVPKEWITVFPSFNGLQYLTALPTLAAGKEWLLLSEIDRNKAITEDKEITTAGHFYKYQITCRIPGNSYYNHLMMENFDYHEWVLLIEERNNAQETNSYRLIGTHNAGALINHNYKSGGEGQAAKGTDVQFVYDTPTKMAVIITSAIVYTGDIPSTQVANGGYATEQWVIARGYLTAAMLSAYATQAWVTSQGYITNAALAGYATETFVTSQGYITNAALAGYATQSFVTSQGYITTTGIPSQATNAGKFLMTNGTTMEWAAVNANPAGADRQIQFNNAGSFGAASNLTYSAGGNLLIGTTIDTGYKLEVNGSFKATNFGILYIDGINGQLGFRSWGIDIFHISNGIISFASDGSHSYGARVNFKSVNHNNPAFGITGPATPGLGSSIQFYAGAGGSSRITPSRYTLHDLCFSVGNWPVYDGLYLATDGTVLIGNTVNVTPVKSTSALLELQSTTKGFLPTRMTAAQAAAIASPEEGLLLYVKDTNATFIFKGWWGYDGTTWQPLNN